MKRRVQSLENFRWRLRNAFKSIIEIDVSETSISDSKSESPRASISEEMEEIIRDDPPQGSAPIAIVESVLSVWLLLRDWLVSRDSEGDRPIRFGRFLKFKDPRNLRQSLFEREKKAIAKYGNGLRLNDGPSGFKPAVDKLSDAAFFLFKTLHQAQELKKANVNEYNRQLDIISDLHSLLGSFIVDLKK